MRSSRLVSYLTNLSAANETVREAVNFGNASEESDDTQINWNGGSCFEDILLIL